MGIGPLLTLVSVSLAEHVPELRFSLPVWHGQLVWLCHAPAAIGTPAPGGSEPGNAPPSLCHVQEWECCFCEGACSGMLAFFKLPAPCLLSCQAPPDLILRRAKHSV